MVQNTGKPEPAMGQYAERPYNVAIVGAAISIGRAAARVLAAEGARVVCLDNNLDGSDETVARSPPWGIGHRPIVWMSLMRRISARL